MGDSTAMTIEFLRARLLSERTVSKAAKERADQLAKRVMELEEQLRVMSIQRKKAEHAAMEAITILEAHGIDDLSEAIDSSSERDESPSGGKICDETFKEDETSTASKEERIEVEDAQSSSELVVSSSQVGGLSWRSRSSSPDSARKLKGKQFRLRQRQISLISSAEPSPKYNLGKSCRKIKRKETGSTAEDKVDVNIIFDDDQPELSGNVCGSQSSSVNVQKQEADDSHYALGSERDEEMERVLEQQAQLIGQYEAEEKAQREWEKKYSENKSSNPDYSELGKQCHVAEINSEFQKESPAGFDRVPYVCEEAKSSICTLSRTNEARCPSDDHVHKLSDAANQGMTDGSQDENIVEFSNCIVPTEDLRKNESGSDSPAWADGLRGQVGNSVAVNDIEACLVEVSFPAKVSTASSSSPFVKQNPGIVYENSDSASSNNINLNAHSHINSSSIRITSTANSRREIPKWELSGSQDLSYVKPTQSAGSSMGGVLEALQRAKISLRQELHKLPLPDQGTKALPAPSNYHARAAISGETLKVPVGSAGLFRIPTDAFPRSQTSDHEIHGSGLSLATGYPHLGYSMTASDYSHSTIPYVEGGSKNSMSTLNIGYYHSSLDLPAALGYSLPYSSLTADKIPFGNETGVSLGKQHFGTYSQGMGIPAFSRHSLPSDLTTDGTPITTRSRSSAHKQHFDSYHLGSEEPPSTIYTLPYQDLTTERMLLHDGISKPYTDSRN